ncbi:hypothetical protein ACLKA7_015965 [Drosophila subpalustris]
MRAEREQQKLSTTGNSSSHAKLTWGRGQPGGGGVHVGVRATWPQNIEAQLTRCCRVTSTGGKNELGLDKPGLWTMDSGLWT